jgi:RNA ligase
MNLPSLEQFLKAEKEKRISAHRQGDLVGFKYTNETIYAEDWDEVTLNARGIVFNEKTGEVVARPFKKFFNYQEFFDGEGNHSSLYEKVPDAWKPNISGHARYMEKVDASLGIVFYNWDTGEWRVKTGGSFDSDQARWGQKWFDENINTLFLIQNRTYLFEIVSNEDIHPIHYDFEGMVLLGVISNNTGEEYSLETIKETATLLKVRMAQVYDFDNFYKAVEWAKKLPKTQEGLVITFDNGFKCKAKSDEWCKLAKMFEGLNKWDVWVAYDIEGDYFHAHVDKHNGYKPIDDEVLFIPEELPDIREYAESVRTRVAEMTAEAIDIAKAAQSYSSERKFQFQYVNTNYPKTVGLVMKALDYLAGKTKYNQVKQVAHKLIQPPPQNTQN